MKINKLKPPFSPEWQMRTHGLPICLHRTAPTLAKAGFLRGMAWPLDVNKKGRVRACPFLEGVASIGQGGVSAGELWASLGWRVCLPGLSRLGKPQPVLLFCNVSLFRLPITTQAVLSPQNHLLGPETLPSSQWQEGGSEPKLAASAAGCVRRQHTGAAASHAAIPPLPLDVASRRQEMGSELGLFCSPGMSNTSSRIHPLSQRKKKNPQQICKKRHLKKIFNHL